MSILYILYFALAYTHASIPFELARSKNAVVQERTFAVYAYKMLYSDVRRKIHFDECWSMEEESVIV